MSGNSQRFRLHLKRCLWQKNATTARTMDLLLFVVRGISVVADQLRQHPSPLKKKWTISL